jgi:hypothetical protein
LLHSGHGHWSQPHPVHASRFTVGFYAANNHLSKDDGSFGLIVEGAGEDDRAMTFTTGTSAYARHVGRCWRRLSAAHADAAVDRPVVVGDVDAGDLDVALSA